MSLENHTQFDTAWAAWCPICGAEVSEPCRFGDRIVPSHEARVESAASLQKAYDLMWACHVLDQVGADLSYDFALGQGRH